jgi:hypothetical protein
MFQSVAALNRRHVLKCTEAIIHISKSFSLIVIVAVVILCTAAATLSPAVEAANVSTAAVKTTPVVAAGVWHSETVDSPGDVGLYNSLQLTPTGWPAISYFDYTNYDLKYAYKSAS